MASYTFDDTFYGYNKRSSAPRKEDDGNVSLTYSAASGESTDSSFAGIMRALEGQEKESEYVLKKERAPEKFSSNTSLSGYSTDGESYLAGTELLQTIAGQSSGEYKNDAHYKQEEPFDMGMFHPPKQPNWKKRSSKTAVEASPSSSIDTPTKAPPETPPMTPRNITNLEKEEEEESWYKQSCCFPDAFDLLRELPKRYK